MKKLIYLMTTLLLFSCEESTDQRQAEGITSPSKNYIAVIDFHNDHRCKSCLTIEKLAKETLAENFQKELDDSTIVFSLINVDSPENEKIAEEYEAFGTALMIDVKNNTEEEILDLTEWAFDAIHSDGFKQEFKKEIETALKKL